MTEPQSTRVGIAMGDATYDRTTQDVGNIVALEHVNVTVVDQTLAGLFYVSGLGFTRDPFIDFGMLNMWVNVGSQQIHLPRGPESQVLRGTVGVVVPSLDELKRRLEKFDGVFGSELEGMQYSVSGKADTLAVTCPWGNRLRVHGASEDFGGLRLGIPYVEIDIAAGGAAGVGRFYEELLRAPAALSDLDGDPVSHVRVGRHQALRFRESSQPLPAYDGHHIAVYLADFSTPYAGLLDLGLITQETDEHEYRFQDIVDLDTGEVLATLEHEVRSTYHHMFGRELINRNAGNSYLETNKFRTYDAAQDSFVGLTRGGQG